MTTVGSQATRTLTHTATPTKHVRRIGTAAHPQLVLTIRTRTALEQPTPVHRD